MNTKLKITRKDTMTHLEQFHFVCELLRIIKHFFPDLVPSLKKVKDPRHQSYITYETDILLMTKNLSSIFYIGSMRKTSENLIVQDKRMNEILHENQKTKQVILFARQVFFTCLFPFLHKTLCCADRKGAVCTKFTCFVL